MRNLFLVFAMLLLSTASWAGNKAALVKIIKGEAFAITGDKKTKLVANDWLESGSVLKTSAKSFVKLVFIDKSQMNVGPLSEIKIEKFHNKDAGVIDLVKGKIRSQVTKDYLQINGKDRSKLFIKTPNAVMGIRGTDFMISTNGKNTAAILFEGEVVFNRLDNRGLNDSAKLDELVDRGVRMFPGEFSAVGENGAPTIPALLSVNQRDKLEKNANFEASKNTEAKASKSIVPPGLKGDVVASKPSLNVDAPKIENDSKARASANPDSFYKDGQIKPANGSMVHVESATIIAPGGDAVLDSNTNTYIASDKSGVINADGSYNPPKGVEINAGGNLLITSADGLKVKEVGVVSPVVAIQPVAEVGARTEQLIYTVVDYKEAVAQTTPPTGSNGSGAVPGAPVNDGGYNTTPPVGDPSQSPGNPSPTDPTAGTTSPTPTQPSSPVGGAVGAVINTGSAIINGATGAIGNLFGN